MKLLKNCEIARGGGGSLAALVAAAICVATTPSPSWAAMTISNNITLTGDADWTANGIVTLDGATIDLAGYTLKIYGVAGNGTITSSNTESIDLTTANGIKEADPKFIYATADGVAVTMSGTGNSIATTTVNNYSSDGSNYPPENAFDNSLATFVCKNSGVTWPIEINYDFQTPRKITGYRIYPYSTASNAGYPESWVFQASNDQAAWTDLDTRTGQTLKKSNWYAYPCDNDTSYRYYRLKITESLKAGRLDLGELEFCSMPANKLQFDMAGLAASDMANITVSDVVSVEAGLAEGDSISLASDLDLGGMEATIAGTIDLAGHTLTVDTLSGGGTITDTSASTALPDLTTTDGLSAANKFIWASTNGVEVVLAGANGNGLDGSKYPAERAFDDDLCLDQIVVDNNGGKGYSFAYYQVPATWSWSSDTYELNYRFAEPTLVNRYRIYPFTPGTSNGSPKTWTFEGSNDGETWKELDSRSGLELDRLTWYEYDIFNTVAYRYYRLRIKDVRVPAKNRIDIGELEFCRRPEPGKVVVNVPAGNTAENMDVTLSGNLRLVKDGAGTLVASKSGQTYIGGTEVAEGTLKCGTTGAGLFGPDGAGVEMENGGTFDINGQKGSIGKYAFVIDGGCLAQTGAMTGDTTSNYQGVLEMTLKADGTFDAEKNMYLGTSTSGIDSRFNLGGNKFFGVIGSGQFLRLQSMTLENGVFEVAGNGGYLLARGGVEASDVDFKLNCAIVVKTGDVFSVRDYEALGGTRSASTQSGVMAVYGTFTPTSDSFYGCTLMNNSTIDLSKRSTALDVYSNFTAGAPALAFEQNAVVNVVLGDKRFPGGKILSWTSETKPANVDTVTFVRADAGRKYSLSVQSDGLYARTGLVISVR